MVVERRSSFSFFLFESPHAVSLRLLYNALCFLDFPLLHEHIFFCLLYARDSRLSQVLLWFFSIKVSLEKWPKFFLSVMKSLPVGKGWWWSDQSFALDDTLACLPPAAFSIAQAEYPKAIICAPFVENYTAYTCIVDKLLITHEPFANDWVFSVCFFDWLHTSTCLSFWQHPDRLFLKGRV